MEPVTILLYHFTRQETGMLHLLLKHMPQVQVVSVERNAYGMSIEEVLGGKPAPALALGRDIQRKMLVLAQAKGQMLHFLLAACQQVTQDPVLRAVVTETNAKWTGLQLYDALLEEEAELTGGRN